MLSFGNPISLKEAEKMYVSAIEIKRRSFDAIEKAVENDTEAKRFYLGNEIAYIFDSAMIDFLYKLVHGDPQKGVVLYIGAKYDEAAISGGRPTLMAFGYNTVTGAGGKEIINLINKEGLLIERKSGPDRFFVTRETAGTLSEVSIDDDEDGHEHPGGGSSDGDNLANLHKNGIPISFDPEHIQPGLFSL